MAEFLGYKYYPFNYEGEDKPKNFVAGWKWDIRATNVSKFNRAMFMFEQNAHEYYLCRSHNQLMFHESWDWLHKVLEKILNIDNQASIELAGAMQKVDLSIVTGTSILAPLGCVYERCVEFILFWNKYQNNEI
jgi:hypothetical protein